MSSTCASSVRYLCHKRSDVFDGNILRVVGEYTFFTLVYIYLITYLLHGAESFLRS